MSDSVVIYLNRHKSKTMKWEIHKLDPTVVAIVSGHNNPRLYCCCIVAAAAVAGAAAPTAVAGTAAAAAAIGTSLVRHLRDLCNVFLFTTTIMLSNRSRFSAN